MLAKHKVGSSTLLTRSIFEPLGNQGLFLFLAAQQFARFLTDVCSATSQVGLTPNSCANLGKPVYASDCRMKLFTDGNAS